MSGGLLVLGLLVLAAGPALTFLGARWRGLLAFVDGFLLASLGGLVLFFLLPESFETAGPKVLIAAALGLALLSAMEKWAHFEPDRAHGIGIAIAVAGLVLHTVVDGIAISGGGHDLGPLGEAVVLHRLPVAIAVWWLVRPRYGLKIAGALLALLGIGTVVGFGLGEQTLAILDGEEAALFTAFVAGALLHVLFHRGAHKATGPKGLHIQETLGAVAGMALLFVLPAHEHGVIDGYGHRFLDLALESAPAVLLGFLMAGVVVVSLPQGTVGWLRRGRPLTQSLKGTAFGIPIPICSCGVVPLYQGLVKRGAPPAAAMAFLVATPELGIESIFLSVPLLGGELTIARLVAAFAAALAVGFFVGRLLKPATEEVNQRDTQPQGLANKARGALAYGLRDVVGDTAAWIIAGVAVAAAVDPGALSGFVERVPFGVDVAVAALIGMPLYVCASGATPLAAALLLAGLSPGAALAFLLAGPATNVTTFGVLTRLHSRGVALLFGGVTIGAAIVLGVIVNLVLGTEVTGWAAEAAHGGDEHGLVAWTSLAALAAVFGWAIVREGPTAFLRPVLTFSGDHHDHDHDHDHDDEEPAPCGAVSPGGSCCG